MPSARKELRSTQDVRDIPKGWVRLSSFGPKSDVRYSAVYAALHNGCIADSECIKFQLTDSDPRGPIYVCPTAANRAIKAAAEPIAKAKPAPVATGIDKRHAESVCESLASIDSTLDEIYRVLERLTTAVESVATQPRGEPAGTWRDINGEAL